MDLIVTTKQDLEELISKVISQHLLNVPGEANTGERDIINTETLCKRLDISEPTIIRMRKRKSIPFMSIGSAIRYDYNEVVKALQNKKK